MIIYDIIWNSNQAGPSPNCNNRVEVFLKGCQRAIKGNPCEGCFNKGLWDFSADRKYSADYVANNIIQNTNNKYITFVGGEPLDQIEGLILVTSKLKKAGFHIIVFTWRKLIDILDKKTNIKTKDMYELLNNIDILIDGEYNNNYRIFNNQINNGLHNAVGSGNQIIWDTNKKIGFKAGDLTKLKIEDRELIFYSNIPLEQLKKRMIKYE